MSIIENASATLVATGRRKKATARVRLIPGSGKVQVNGREGEEYFPEERMYNAALLPLQTAEVAGQFDVWVRTEGGGIHGQAIAVSLGIARALLGHDPELRKTLKDAGHLKRDPRRRERKKAGQPGARKRFQFSKR